MSAGINGDTFENSQNLLAEEYGISNDTQEGAVHDPITTSAARHSLIRLPGGGNGISRHESAAF